jgi:hypothetical protein
MIFAAPSGVFLESFLWMAVTGQPTPERFHGIFHFRLWT